jgi:gluconate 5-dehydrogenase
MEDKNILGKFSLEGKIALVTGGSYGIGMAIAKALAYAGAKIAFNGRRANLIADAEKEYASLGINAKGYVFDITNEADVQKFVPQIEKDFGGSIDILVNNAGIIKRIPATDMTVEEFRQVIDIDLTGAFIMSKAVAPGMIAKGGGKIINVCSLFCPLNCPLNAGRGPSGSRRGNTARFRHWLPAESRSMPGLMCGRRRSPHITTAART